MYKTLKLWLVNVSVVVKRVVKALVRRVSNTIQLKIKISLININCLLYVLYCLFSYILSIINEIRGKGNNNF